MATIPTLRATVARLSAEPISVLVGVRCPSSFVRVCVQFAGPAAGLFGLLFTRRSVRPDASTSAPGGDSATVPDKPIGQLRSFGASEPAQLGEAGARPGAISASARK